MIRIAVCDDNKLDLEIVNYMMAEYIRCRNSLEFEITAFSGAFQLMDYIEKADSDDKFDIYLLDMIMPVLKGIDLGKEIRTHDSSCHIVFITSADEYATASYDITASGYIMKPVTREKLFQILDGIISRISSEPDESENCITIKTKDGIRHIKLHTIMYAEYNSHTIKFHIFGGETADTVTGSLTMSKLAEMINSDRRFIMPHRAFIVNMRYVASMNGQNFVMQNNDTVPVSRTSLKETRKKYIEFSR